MPGNIEISVICPVYNTGQCLRRCIESIAAQTFTQYELVLVDDGSTNGTFIDKDDNGNELTAITGAAYWTAEKTSGFSKAGICISNVQNDYYNIQFVYPNVRKAIAVMNPSPIN